MRTRRDALLPFGLRTEPRTTHFPHSGYVFSRPGSRHPSDIMLNRRSAFSRQSATAKVRSPNDQSAHPSSPSVARRPKACLLPMRRGRNNSTPNGQVHHWPTLLTCSSPRRCRRSKGPRCGQRRKATRAGIRCRIPFPAMRRVPLCPGPHGQKPHVEGNPPP